MIGYRNNFNRISLSFVKYLESRISYKFSVVLRFLKCYALTVLIYSNQLRNMNLNPYVHGKKSKK